MSRRPAPFAALLIAVALAFGGCSAGTDEAAAAPAASSARGNADPNWVAVPANGFASADFAAARAELARLEADGHEPAIDPYAAEDEAEGFAVFTETFFAAPDLLRIAYPKVYDHLRAFYRQDPIVRFSGA